MRFSTALFAGTVLAAAAGTANAALITTFGFTDLNSSYTSAGPSGVFSARASNLPGLRTSGDVTRTIPAEGTARYLAGFYDPTKDADFRLNINVTSISPGPIVSTALGSGRFRIVDDDGDSIEGDISGFWIKSLATGNNNYFNGTLTNVEYKNPSDDGTFNGPNGGSFDMTFPGGPFYEGSIVELFTSPTSGFFSTSFERVSSQVSGTIIPTPGALALVGFGLVAAGRRRR